MTTSTTMMMIKASCPQVSLNLNDISSHTKQIGETSRLVQQVSADFEIFNFFFLLQNIQGVGEQNGGGGSNQVLQPPSYTPPTLDLSSSTNNSCPPPPQSSSSAIVTMSNATSTTTSAIVTMTSTPTARVTDLFDTERGSGSDPGSQV